MENLNDKFSIKNLLFSKVFPNYVVPEEANGHKLYPCTGCGDKFIFESSYNDHVNRKSVNITYMCRNCNIQKTFFNRCNLLSHIRSHGFKTATINVTDLKLEPLPICNYKVKLIKAISKPKNDLSTISAPSASKIPKTSETTTTSEIPLASEIPTTSEIPVTNEIPTTSKTTITSEIPTTTSIKIPTTSKTTITSEIPTTTSIKIQTTSKTTITSEIPTTTSIKIPTTSKTTITSEISTTTSTKIPTIKILSTNQIPTSETQQNITYTAVTCLECKENLTTSGSPNKDRASHYMQFSNEIIYSCPICLFALPSICAFKAHLRLHLKLQPYCCPECGIQLSNKNVFYPYNHDCEGFKMMRATARLSCADSKCNLFHPNDYKEHMKQLHMKKIYKCPYCVVACFNAISMHEHLNTHKTDTKPLVFYKCEMCPGKFVLQSRVEWHLKCHKVTCVFPCWPCGAIFKDVSLLLSHFLAKHNGNSTIESAVISLISKNEVHSKDSNKKRVYRVVKRCDQCRRSFIYRCQYAKIHDLPNECPYKCSSTFGSTELDVVPDRTPSNTHITCHLCKTNISQDWNEIKKHYAALHKKYKCLDAKIVLTRTDLKKYLSERHTLSTKRIISKKTSRKNRRQQQSKHLKISSDVDNVPLSTQASETKADESRFSCNMCGNSYEQKILLERHMISHRDPCMAYQCMECGQSFVVKPSFSKHLLLEHNVSDIEEYIKEKQCYNENAFIKYQSKDIISNEPLRENQCKICREDFEVPDDLAKHFRTHGMAFLMKNNPNKSE